MGQKLLICDFDGTLFNAWDWMIVSAEQALKHVGIEVPREDIEAFFSEGMHLRKFYETCAPGEGVNHLIALHREKQSTPEMMATVVPYPGVLETIPLLYDRGVKLGIATSRGSRGDFIQTLQTHKLLRQFDAAVCLEDVKNAKPDPECLFKVMDILGSDPSNTFFVGDTISDVEAGKSAGVTTIGALYGFGGNEMIQSKPNHLIGSFDEVIKIVLS